MPQVSPHEEYTRRLAARREAIAALDRQHLQYGNVRLLIGALAALIAWKAFGWWLLLPVFLFIAMLVAHERLLRRRDCERRAAAVYERGLARLEDRWMGEGETGERFLNEEHPYAADLDIFGTGSVFQLLSTARTRMGEWMLAQWLLKPAAPDVLRERHAAIEELRDRLDLREDLAVLGEDVRVGVNPNALSLWASGEPLLPNGRQRAIALAIPVLLAVAFGLLLQFGWREVFLAVALLEIVFAARLRPKVLEVFHAVEDPAHDLALLEAVLTRLEAEHFTSPLLARLRVQLDCDHWPASKRISRLKRWVELIDSRDNVFVRLIGPPLLWGTHCALAVEAWRRTSGQYVPGWLAAIGEFEALSALASYRYEHPADVFPEFTAETGMEGEALGHPLLPVKQAVTNDLRLGGELRFFVVSGSNMSGKSTMLRTLGVNAVLAQAGAPVRAARLRLSPLQVCASIRVTDSLQGGKSRFYAEISRLRRFLDLTREPLPVLFLLDELLNGTNSKDRAIGAEAVVRGLVERGGIGLLTTHDLALAHIADAHAPRGANVHFEDHLEEGRISFDYKMRPGVVTKSNALELMRAVGLLGS